MKFHRALAFLIGVLVFFAAVAKGAHDIWAATIVYLSVLSLASALLIYSRVKGKPGLLLPLVLPALLLIAMIFVSFRQAINPSESFLAFADWCTAVALFFIAANVFEEESAVAPFLVFLVPCLLIQAIACAADFSYSLFRSSPEVRGTLINANVQSAFALFWVPVLVDRIRREGGLKKTSFAPWVWFLGLLLLSIILFMTQSAWALICIVAFLPWLVTDMVGRSTQKFIRNFFFAVVLAVILYKIMANTGANALDRIAWWRTAVKMFLKHPIFGVGTGNFPSAYVAYRVPRVLNTLYAHSFPLGFLAETGIAGAVSLLVFVLLWFRAAIPQIRKNPERRPFFIGVILFFFYSTISLSTEYLVNLMVLATFMGLVVAKEPSQRRPVRTSMLIIACGLALSALPFLISPFLASRAIVDGQYYLRQKEWGMAETSFNSAIKLDARAWEPYAGLARIASVKGDMRRAVDLQKEALARNRLHPVLQLELENYERLLR